MRLISFNLCPFVQRAAIVANAKSIALDCEFIDISNKPDWFLKISPLGKVPVLEVENDVVFESGVICEYLNEIKAPNLHPEDALQRAKNRAWIEFGSGLLMVLFYIMIAQDEAELNKQLDEFSKKLTQLEAVLGQGPFFNGQDFRLIDAAYAPLFMRAVRMDELKPLHLLKSHPKCQAWSDALLQVPAVIGSEIDDYVEVLRSFMAAKGSVLV